MKQFSLAGLLRLRHTQQDIAGTDLARAHGRVRDNAATEKRARQALAEFGETATSTETLRAIASSRQASAAMLAELADINAVNIADLERAQHEYNAARTRSVGLEKLEIKHREQMFAAELKAEQDALDEITNTRTTTPGEEA